MSRKGRGDKKVLEIARTETFGRGNLGPLCFLPRIANVVESARCGRRGDTSQRDVPTTQRSAARSRLSADGLGNVRGAHWHCHGGTPRIFLSALGRRKAADPASHQCRRQVSWLIDKVTRKRLWSPRVRPLLATRARAGHF